MSAAKTPPVGEKVPVSKEVLKTSTKDILVRSKKEAMNYLFKTLLPLERKLSKQVAKNERLEAEVEAKRLMFISLRDKDNHLLAEFPSLEMETIRVVARSCESEVAKREHNRIERERNEVYKNDPQDWGDYEMFKDDLRALDEEERELEDHLRNHYAFCERMLQVKFLTPRWFRPLVLF